MAKFLSEKAILTKLKTSSFESLTDDQLAIFSSILYKMHPKVSRAAMDNFLDFQHDAQIILQSLKKKSSRGMDYSDSDEVSIQNYLSQTMQDVKNRLGRPDFTFGDKLFVEDNLILLSQIIALYKLNFKRLILNELKYIAKGAMLLAPVILIFAYFFHKSDESTSMDDDIEDSDDDLENEYDRRERILESLSDDEYFEFMRKMNDDLYDEYLDPDSPFYEPGPPIILDDDYDDYDDDDSRYDEASGASDYVESRPWGLDNDGY